MIPKRKAPHLNRKQRRHPVRELAAARIKGGLTYILAGLMLRGGFLPKPTGASEGAQV